jgi:tetratricopeptide (TPR) repeat protein
MLKEDLSKLIASLSASEKRSFRTYCKQQSGLGLYASLFEIYIKSSVTPSNIENDFEVLHPKVSFDNTASYLFKVLTDMLTLSRIQQDKWFSQVFSVMKAKLYTERSLPDRALKELRRTQQQSQANEDHLLSYLCARMELSQLARTGFKDLNQQDLIAFQMRSKKTLQILRQTHEHHSLYELLSHKLLKEGISLSDKSDKSLDDLVLTELGIITQGSSHRFESRKLHLLFQSYFFIHKGDYNAALNLFKQLNKLMEENEAILDFPPYDYLDTLEGIISSLISIKYYEEMPYFINKIADLQAKKFPEHFSNLTHQIISIYEMAQLSGQQRFEEALQSHERNRIQGRFKEVIVSPEKYIEYLFNSSVAYLHCGKIKKANDSILQAIDIGRQQMDLPIFRACRLLQLLLHAELNDQEFISYEIRAYKRVYVGKAIALTFERSFFALITTDLQRISFSKRKRLVQRIEDDLEKISDGPYEQKILSYFDFIAWINKRIHYIIAEIDY